MPGVGWTDQPCALRTPPGGVTPRFSAGGGGEKSKEKGAGEACACDQDVRMLCDKRHAGVC